MTLYIFDIDGTLLEGVQDGDRTRPPNRLDEQRFKPGVVARCHYLLSQRHMLAVCTNQGGVAFGFMTPTTVHLMVQAVADAIGATVWAVCVVHPKGRVPEATRESSYRKPSPGMLQYLMDASGVLPEDTVFIGDMDTDREAAEAAGVRFEWAHEFFGEQL